MIKQVGGIIFNYDYEYILVQIKDEKYQAYLPIVDLHERYNPLIYIMKGYHDDFGKQLTCWDHIINYDEIDYYTIVTNLDEIWDNLSSEYDVININDINNVNCDDSLKWLIYLSLDSKIRNKKIIQNEEKR